MATLPPQHKRKISQQELSSEDSTSLSPRKGSTCNVALVCDWLTTPGGAEKVLLELHHMYPDAPIYTSQYSKKGINWFNDAKVKTGWLQIFPKSLRKFLGPLRQIYFSHLDLSSYDLVISVTGAEAKSVRTAPNTKHLCYCHVPTQYYWQMYDKYIDNPGFGILNPFVRLCFKLLVKPLRKADYRAAQQPDQFLTISTYARQQIKKYYDRDAIIVAPPVEIDKFKPNPQAFPQKNAQLSTRNTKVFHKNSTASPQYTEQFSTENPDLSTAIPQHEKDLSTDNARVFHKFSTSFPQYHYQPNRTNPHPEIICPNPPKYYIIACRQVTWKRVDLAIKACQQLNLPLLVVGDGPERMNLLNITHDNSPIKFLPWAETWELARYLQGAKGYIFPSLEPFGIAAVEALAAGCPVIAYCEGGSRDFIKNGKNGLLFDQQTTKSLVDAICKFQNLDFDKQTIIASSANFSPAHFRQGITNAVQTLLRQNSPQNHSSHPTENHQTLTKKDKK